MVNAANALTVDQRVCGNIVLLLSFSTLNGSLTLDVLRDGIADVVIIIVVGLDIIIIVVPDAFLTS